MRKWNAKRSRLDRCVVCGAATEYARSVPIDKRFGYIQGSGQLCRRCYMELYSGRSR